MTERRKLNNVYMVPYTLGVVTIRGEIGSGKTREDVLLQKRADIKGDDFMTWWHRRGGQWSKLKGLVEE
jgi:hypothetical protein